MTGSSRLRVTLALLVIVAGAGACGSSGSRIGYTDGLRRTQPSQAQLAAMVASFKQKYGPEDLAGVPHPPTMGCAATSMATQQEAGVLNAYAYVFCETCPAVVYGGVTPAAFRLRGTSVISVSAPTATDGPTFDRQVEGIFPHQLWRAADSEAVPGLSSLRSAAHVNAGC
jgi:hypothetical protein